jgi:acyl-CoA thioester hydrolase
MIEPNLGAPLDVHRATVLPEWIDWNGHMNVGFYVVAFDKATDTLCQQFGCGWEYTRDKLGMTFVLEAHVTYDREVKEGDPLAHHHADPRPRRQAHPLHPHDVSHDREGYLAATNELMLMNIDYQTRRSAPWPEFAMERIEKLAAAHAGPPRPKPKPAALSVSRRSSSRLHVAIPALRTARTRHTRTARHAPLDRRFPNGSTGTVT